MRFSDSQYEKVKSVLLKRGYDESGITWVFNQANYGNRKDIEIIQQALKESES